MIWVTEAKHEGDYRLMLRFNDGLSAVVDLEPVLARDARSIFRSTHDPEAFRHFRVDMDTVVWETGLDLAPEFLHELARRSAAA